MIRRWPPTTCVSLEKACMLSRVRVLARLASVRFRTAFGAAARKLSIACSTSSEEYQTSRLRIAANVAMASR